MLEQAVPAESRPRQEKTAAPVSPRTLPVLSVWLRDLMISLAISAFIIVFLYQPVKVEGTSMMPSLDDQDAFFVNKYVYRLEPIQRGDIVVFRYPRDTQRALSNGDRSGGRSHPHRLGRSIRQRERSKKTNVPSGLRRPAVVFRDRGAVNSYFVLGDHRTMSNDSRDFGRSASATSTARPYSVLADGQDGKGPVRLSLRLSGKKVLTAKNVKEIR